MKKVTLLMSGIMVMSCAPQQKKLVYPKTAKVDTEVHVYGVYLCRLGVD